MELSSGAIAQLSLFLIILYLFLIVWSLIWKGIALWKASRNNHLMWFIILLIVNTLGILEIFYIFGFSKKKRGK